MNNRVGGWGCAFTKLSGGGVPGNSPRMRRGRRFSEFAERKALPRAPPSSTASIRAEAIAIFDLELPARRRRDPQICCSAAPARTATAVLVFFFFCRRSGCLAILSSCLRPSACCCCCSGDNCISLYNPERLFRAHKILGSVH